MFTRKTFEYFEKAKKNKNNKKWFLKNKPLYEEYVRKPISELVIKIGNEFQTELPRIDINPRSITRPLRPKNKVGRDGALIKTQSHVGLAEKRTSLFEWNPGIYFQAGADKDDNFFGLGLYMVSSRQMSLLRHALVDNFEEIDEILSNRKLKKAWGSILGDKFKRFPKGFQEQDPRSGYLWHKQFYLGQSFSRTEMQSKKFLSHLVNDLGTAMPFFQWVRKSVGTYKRL